MKLDERFLKVHPRTAEWLKQREKCFHCSNLIFDKNKPSMRCAAFAVAPEFKPTATPAYREGMAKALAERDVKMYCIDARELDGPCGPEARSFSAVVAPAAGATDNSTNP